MMDVGGGGDQAGPQPPFAALLDHGQADDQGKTRAQAQEKCRLRLGASQAADQGGQQNRHPKENTGQGFGQVPGRHPARDHDQEHDHDGVENGAACRPTLDHQQIDQDQNGHQEMGTADEGPPERWDIAGRHALEAQLQGLQMRNVEQPDIGDQRRYDRRDDDVEIADTDQFRDDEGGRPHDRRHQLTVGRGGHLDGSGLDRRHAHFAHHRDGEDAGGHHIGDRGSGNQPGHARGQDGRLGRTAAEPADQGESQIEEIAARAGPVEKGAEQNEEKDETDRHTDRYAEDGLPGQPVITDQPGRRNAPVRDQFGHRLAENGISQEDQRENHQRPADGPAGRFQKQQNAGAGEQALEGNGEAEKIDTQQTAEPVGDAFLVDKHPESAKAAEGGEPYIQR